MKEWCSLIGLTRYLGEVIVGGGLSALVVAGIFLGMAQGGGTQEPVEVEDAVVAESLLESDRNLRIKGV